MKIFYWQEILSGKFADFFENGCALTVGSFDGPHNGHKILFSDVISFAKSHNILKGIITFSQSISKIKHRDEFPGNITTLHQRLSFFEKKSFDFVVIIDFTENFSKISGADFFTILSASFSPIPLMAPEPRYLLILLESSGGIISNRSIRICMPKFGCSSSRPSIYK